MKNKNNQEIKPSKKLPASKFLQDLIIKGVNIERKANEENASYSDNQNLLDEVFREYKKWDYNIKELLKREEIIRSMKEAEMRKMLKIVHLSYGIPLFLAGIKYVDIEGKASKNLFKKIRLVIEKKLRVLTDLDINLSSTQSLSREQVFHKKRLNFDYKTSILSLDGCTFYKPRNPEIKNLLRILWINKQDESKKGKIIKKGKRLEKMSLAIRAELIKERIEFKRKRRRFNYLIKGFRKMFNSQGFPLKINRTSKGLLLIYEKNN